MVGEAHRVYPTRGARAPLARYRRLHRNRRCPRPAGACSCQCRPGLRAGRARRSLISSLGRAALRAGSAGDSRRARAAACSPPQQARWTTSRQSSIRSNDRAILRIRRQSVSRKQEPRGQISCWIGGETDVEGTVTGINDDIDVIGGKPEYSDRQDPGVITSIEQRRETRHQIDNCSRDHDRNIAAS